MASIFTYDPDPPRVSSPWLNPEEPGKKLPQNRSPSSSSAVQEELLSQYGVTKLDAEPQDGPTEYKLHLLLRTRRAYTSMTTHLLASRPRSAKPSVDPKPTKPASIPMATSTQTRQMRLQQLTTQLLWRLQQSSPYHASTSKDIVIPHFPDDSVDLSQPLKPEKLLPGLEESRGALYEIGVADDGTFVGLAKDEMDESIATLKIMAASLGCKIEILRMVSVGECEWHETTNLVDNDTTTPAYRVRRGRLWVSEVLVTPDTDPTGYTTEPSTGQKADASESVSLPSRGQSTTDQLRVTLTGPTTSGKSTLLGTLSTGTLDNGRGMSRLSLLKHQHEVASGITSSVAQELIGYKDGDIFNYSSGNIESWVDIHDCSENGRLIFVSDSAGHPRYRRTILRGLVGWAPHWSVLCLAADDVTATDNGPNLSPLGFGGGGTDLAKAHLDLCLKLESPLAIVITKLDLASKASMARLLGRVLTRVKEVGRVPEILKPNQRACNNVLTKVPEEDTRKVKRLTEAMAKSGNLLTYVPIILTSAVKGIGIGLTHALLEALPLPPPPTAHDFTGMALNPEQPACLFHVDDKYSLPASYASLASRSEAQLDLGTVVSGYLRFGRLSVGDKVVVGPFPAEDYPKISTPDDRPSPGSYGLSISHPSSAELTRIATRNAVSASTVKGQWHNAQIVSIRNLRLPVLTLEGGQAGTIGVVLDISSTVNSGHDFDRHGQDAVRIRKGMVLAVPTKHMTDTGISLQAASGLTAIFHDADASSLALGSLVNIYVASVRAAARVTRVTLGQKLEDPSNTATEDIDDIFSLNENLESPTLGDQGSKVGGVEVSLELLTNREWIELGSRVIVLEGASKDRSGLEGFVGKVVEIFD
jgi:GTPase